MKKTAIAILLALTLAGCDRGLDRTFDTSSNDAFAKSIEKMVSEASAQEAEIFRAHAPFLMMGAVLQAFTGETTDFSKLTGRQAISNLLQKSVAEQEGKVAEIADEMKTIEEQKAAVANVIDKIQLLNPEYSPRSTSKEFFESSYGQEVRFQVVNGSHVPLRSIRVQVSMFIDGKQEPAASSETFHIFQNGLDQGKQSLARVWPAGAFSNDGGWDKLSIQKATDRRVTVMLQEVENYDKQTLARVKPEDEAAVLSKMESAKAKLDELRQQLTVLSKK